VNNVIAEILSTLIVFALLFGCALLGRFVRPRLPESHRAHETVTIMQTMVGMLVTLAALVLGLVTGSVRSAYDGARHDRQQYALEFSSLDRCLRDYGPEADGIRGTLASYVAGVIASTWPSEHPSLGIAHPNTAGMARTGANPQLASLMNEAGIAIRSLRPANALQTATLEDCRADYRDVLVARRAVLTDIKQPISPPFYEVLVFWLMIIFAAFGLLAPYNNLSTIAVIFCAISLSSAVLVILDLSHPYGGFFSISSEDMRGALADLVAPKRP
jgi:hypothetical protein